MMVKKAVGFRPKSEGSLIFDYSLAGIKSRHRFFYKIFLIYKCLSLILSLWLRYPIKNKQTIGPHLRGPFLIIYDRRNLCILQSR